MHIVIQKNISFCRHKDETLKELSAEERRELNNKENSMYGSSYSMYSSPRRETALKIYLDPTPKISTQN